MATLIDLFTLSHDAVIDLYKIDLTPMGYTTGTTALYFTNYHDQGNPLQWAQQTYTPIPIGLSDLEWNGQGALPTPTLSVSNVLGQLTALCQTYRDFANARLIIYRVFAANLAAANFNALRTEVWQVERKASEDDLQVSFTLNSYLDMEGQKAPNRPIMANSCPWLAIGGYRGAYCGHTGAMFDISNLPTAIAANDKCKGDLPACRIRGNIARYGGMPGVDNQRFR